MVFRTILGLLIVLVVSSCVQHPSKSELRIVNGVNRGSGYTDSLGTDYNIRYIPITITNDSTIPIHLQIAFSNKYDYPIAYGDWQFNVIPLPAEWALDGVEITDNMINELQKYIKEPTLNKTIEPGEELVLAIGTRYGPTGVGILPDALFIQSDSTNFQACNSVKDQVELSDPPLALVLKLDFYRGTSQESYTIIPCGQISYPPSTTSVHL